MKNKICISVDEETRFMIDYIKKTNNPKTIAIVSNTDAFGQTYLNSFSKNWDGEKYVFSHDLTERDFSTTIEKIKARNIKTIYISMNAAPTLIFLNQLKKQNYNGNIYMNWLGESNVLLAENVSEGIIYSYPYKPSNNPKDMVKYNKLKGNSLSLHPLTMNSYDAVYLYAELLKECNEDDISCLTSKIQTVHFKGLGGDISFNSNGIANRQLYLKQIKNGEGVYL